MRYMLLVMAATTMAITTTLYTNSTEAATGSKKVAVWYPGWGTAGISDYESVSGNIATVDEINPYWYALKADGSVASYEWAEDPKLLALARDNGKPMLPLISNEFDPGRVSKMLDAESSRKAHADELVSLVVNKGYAGLDVDYEMLYAEDRDKFSAFVEDLASQLHTEGKKLAVTVHPKTSEPGTWDGQKSQDYKRLGSAADELKIMIYDYHWNGSKAGPASPPGG